MILDARVISPKINGEDNMSPWRKVSAGEVELVVYQRNLDKAPYPNGLMFVP